MIISVCSFKILRVSEVVIMIDIFFEISFFGQISYDFGKFKTIDCIENFI